MDIPNLAPRPARVGPAPWSHLAAWPSLPEMFTQTAQKFPDRACFTVFDPDEEHITYARAHQRMLVWAADLRRRGVAPGDRVGLCGKNSPEWALGFFAILFCDAVVVPLDASLKGEEVRALLVASGARMLWADQDRLEVLTQAGIPDGVQLLSLEASPEPALAPLAAPLRRGDDLAALLYTSGTTGNPKGVMLTHENLVSDAFLAQYNMPLFPTDVFYALLPIHHSYTLVAVFLVSMSCGAEVVFGKKMVVSQILKDLKQAKVTMFLGVPLLFNRLLAGILKGIKDKGPVVNGVLRFLMSVSGLLKKTTGLNPGKALFGAVLSQAGLADIRICISGGGPLPASTFRGFNQLGVDFVQGYGLTETSPIVTINPTWHYKETSVGSLIPQVELKILEPDSNGQGVIALRGPMVMKGYYQNPEATAEVLSSDGWLNTGDVGYIDDEHYVYLTGRAKNLIVTEGGKNVYPEEIEDRFQLFSEVDQILVRGYVVDEATRAEGIEAVIYPQQEPKRPTDERLAAIVSEVNTGLHVWQKITKTTFVAEPMEMTSTKKIKRFTVG
ncbi:MAG: AMP-binding protein [Spirochaetales bacterium]